MSKTVEEPKRMVRVELPNHPLFDFSDFTPEDFVACGLDVVVLNPDGSVAYILKGRE